MAILGTFKRIITEDFDKKDQDLVSKIGYAINSFADDLSNALNKNLTINDNFNQTQSTITVTVDKFGNPTSTTTFKTSLPTTSSGVQVIKASRTSTSKLPGAAITGIPVGSSAIITSPNHGLSNGNVITVTNTDSTPSIDGIWSVFVIDRNTFSIPVSITSVGTKGNYALRGFPSCTPFISYTENNGIITITNVSGIPPNQQFSLTIVIYS